ncbi:MAG TPA: Crp/Fnr family transcriptional regulator [Pyrinomonadaceae bacterium]
MSEFEKSQSLGNRILAALPREEYERLAPRMQPCAFEQGDSIYEPNEPIEHAYFPLGGMVSVLTPMQDGSSVEVGVVGREGFLGFPPLIGIESAPTNTMSQIPGPALKIEAGVLKQEFDRGGTLQLILNRYIHAQVTQLSQVAACNRLHDVNERLARWLLLAHDRVEEDRLQLTHEFLSQMLGANRATVSLTAGVFQQAGLIRYTRGMVTVLNRVGLETAACECYGVMRAELDRPLVA